MGFRVVKIWNLGFVPFEFSKFESKVSQIRSLEVFILQSLKFGTLDFETFKLEI